MKSIVILFAFTLFLSVNGYSQSNIDNISLNTFKKMSFKEMKQVFKNDPLSLKMIKKTYAIRFVPIASVPFLFTPAGIYAVGVGMGSMFAGSKKTLYSNLCELSARKAKTNGG